MGRFKKLPWLDGKSAITPEPAKPQGDAKAEGDKLIMVGQEVGGRVEPCLMFDPRKGTPLPELGDLPILRRKDVVVKDVDAFLQQHGDQCAAHDAGPTGDEVAPHTSTSSRLAGRLADASASLPGSSTTPATRGVGRSSSRTASTTRRCS